ncbi:MAG: 2-alkenal reductase [Parcubacteria group bacterium GW2011_GWB1_42_6]|nr:MAG: 2-alkenal reductase [Parcubacteria group bacterium GW2011_GWB1_42_6]
MDQQKNFFNKIIVYCVLISAAAGFVAGALAIDLYSNVFSGELASQNGILEVVNQNDQVIKVVEQASPAVVSIIVSKDLSVLNNPFGGFFDNFLDNLRSDLRQEEIGGGTGFIVSQDGMILTNKHVVEDESAKYTVLTNDGRRFEAKVLAKDPVQDIAIIKIDQTGLPVLKLGNSDNVKVGQTAIAIGNALGEFRNTVSVGVISGLGRSIEAVTGRGFSAEQLEGVIQTDAAINSGNSGGPLLDLNGEVVGINVAVAQGAQSIGFSLPINKAKRDIDQVRISGKISYPFLGVRYVLIDSEIRQRNNLSVDYGALILRGSQDEPAIALGSPAEKAGLEENDIILEVEGRKVTADNSLAQQIQKRNIGEEITLKILSRGQEKNAALSEGGRTAEMN